MYKFTPIPRHILAKFLDSNDAILRFEKLMQNSGDLIPSTLDEVDIAAGAAQANAMLALGLLASIEQSLALLATAPVPFIADNAEDVDPLMSEVDAVTAEMQASLSNLYQVTGGPTGYPIDANGEVNHTDSMLSFNDGTRTFSTTPTGTSFDFYVKGRKFTKFTAQSLTITDTEGEWFFYFDAAGNLIGTQTFDISLIYNSAYTANIYWDAVNKKAIHLGDERHGCVMDFHTHVRLHENPGTIFTGGCALNTFSVDGSGSLAVHAQWGVDAGAIRDEDIDLSRAAVAATVGLPVFWKTGASGLWRRTANAGYSILTTGTGRASWNQLTGGAWQQTEVTNNNFVLTHVFATNDFLQPYFAVMGQADYATLTQARAGADVEINNINEAGLPFKEWFWIGTVIYQSSNSYSNAVKSRVRSTDTGANYVDGRFTNITPAGVSVSNHANLSNLAWIASGHVGTADTVAAFNGSGVAILTPASSFGGGSIASNVISGTTVVSADTSYIVIGYLDIAGTFDLIGNAEVL